MSFFSFALNAIDTAAVLCETAYESGQIVRRWWDNHGHRYARRDLRIARWVLAYAIAIVIVYVLPVAKAAVSQAREKWPIVRRWLISRAIDFVCFARSVAEALRREWPTVVSACRIAVRWLLRVPGIICGFCFCQLSWQLAK